MAFIQFSSVKYENDKQVSNSLDTVIEEIFFNMTQFTKGTSDFLLFQVEIWFDDYSSSSTAADAIRNVPYQEGRFTYTHRALKQIYDRMVIPEVSGLFC